MSVLHRLASQAAERNTLFSVLLELTYRCNLDCFFCYNDLGKQGKLLSTERYMSLLEELRDLGVLNLTLSGGEPLAHPSFWEIGKRAADLAFSTRIKTNGHSVDGAVARRLFDEVRPFLVEVSLHGAGAESHDRQTRVPGSFDRLMRNLSSMVAAGLHVKLNSTITDWNVREIEGMYAIADGLGVALATNFSISPRDNGDREPFAIAPSQEDQARAVSFLASRDAARGVTWGADPVDEEPVPSSPGKSRKNCGIGSTALTVDPYGDVFPCVQWRRPVGNLHEQSVREIWFGNPKIEEVREVSVEAARMVDSLGPKGRLMAFCPALAQMETGSPLKLYPGAVQRAEAFSRPIVIDDSKMPVVPVSFSTPVPLAGPASLVPAAATE